MVGTLIIIAIGLFIVADIASDVRRRPGEDDGAYLRRLLLEVITTLAPLAVVIVVLVLLLSRDADVDGSMRVIRGIQLGAVLLIACLAAWRLRRRKSARRSRPPG